jgi:hypothetical protein
MPDARTIRANLLRIRRLATVAELVEARREFQRRYNGRLSIE